jgi:hypothetical protein
MHCPYPYSSHDTDLLYKRIGYTNCVAYAQVL